VCGTVFDRNVSMLLSQPQRYFTYLDALAPVIEEALLVPFYLDGRPVGTIWVISHRKNRRFDAEDLRLLESMGAFAAAAYRQGQQSEKNLRRAEKSVTQEEALQQSEAKYRTLFQTIDDGSCVMELLYDHTGKITDLILREVNLAFERHTGLQDVIGKRVSQVLPNLAQYWIDGYTRVARTGEPTRSETYVADLDRWYSVHQSSIGGAGSRFVALVFEDITERKRREREQACLLKLSDELRPLTDAIAVQHAASTIIGEHLEVSRAFYYATERGPEGFVHIVAQDFYKHADMPSLVGRHLQSEFGKAVYEKLGAGETLVVPDVNQLPVLTPTELQRYLSLSVQAIVNVPLIKNGEFVGGLVALHSLPKRWRADEVALVEEVAERTWAAVERTRAEAALRASEEQLQNADRRKDEFLAMLAHELRNPMAALRAGLEVVGEGGSTPEPVEGVRASMKRQLGHMVRLIDDLLDISRITSGKIQLRRAPTLLADIINGAVEANRSAFERARIRVTTNVPDEPCVLDVDATRMVQALSNLLQNAVKFTSADGHIEICASITEAAKPDAARRLALTVSDDGAGIPLEMLPRIFGLFNQGQQAQGYLQPGLGIGLALTRKLDRNARRFD
jgi:PAS domain S-box-containing protein